MTTTPNLDIDHIAASQAQKEVTANAAFDALDSAMCGLTSIAIANVDTVLTDAQMLGCAYMKFTGTLTAIRAITIPGHNKTLIVENSTTGGYSITINTSGGSAVTLVNAAKKILYCDTTTFSTVAEAASTAANPYDLGGSYIGKPAASAVLLRFPMTRAVRFPTSLAASQGIAGTAALASTTFVVAKNGTGFGTMVFGVSGTVATFTGTQTDFAAGDIFTLTAPGTADDNLSDIGFAFAGTRL